jgi:uncharacterized protein YoxC
VPVIDPQLVAILAIAACIAALVLLVVVVVLALRLRAVRRTLRRAFGSGGRNIDIVEMLDLQRAEAARLREETARLHTEIRQLREDRRGVVSRIALVRYDAFDDMGGALSFSAALLDDHRHGMVISAINGRSETRCYAKPVVDGRSEHTLSSEEDEAISAAIEGRPATAPTEGRGRRRAS